MSDRIDFIIIGQGIVGTIAAHYLLNAGFKIAIVDFDRAGTASKVAAGLFNPITYRRFVKSWKADLFYPEADDFYKKNEQLIGKQLLFPTPFLKIFNDIREQNDWLAATGDKRIEEYVSPHLFEGDFDGRIQMPHGGGVVEKAGYVKLVDFLKLNQSYFQERELLYLVDQHIEVEEDEAGVFVELNNRKMLAKRVLYCEGANAPNNEHFNWLPFQPVKGEVLVVRSKTLNIKHAINKGFFILPIGDDLYKVGSTYDWRNPNETPTEAAQQELLDKFCEVTQEPFEVVEHVAGVRPAIKDRHPVVGPHPENDKRWIFNGTGSKGVMMVPWVAKHLVDHLQNGTPLDREIGINRFLKYYQAE